MRHFYPLEICHVNKNSRRGKDQFFIDRQIEELQYVAQAGGES